MLVFFFAGFRGFGVFKGRVALSVLDTGVIMVPLQVLNRISIECRYG